MTGADPRSRALEPGRIEVRKLSRSFRILHERNLTLKETVLRGRRTRATQLWALRDVSFDVPPGQALAVVGQNGSGKSTLLKVLAGIIPPHRGTVAIGGNVAAMLELGAGFHADFTGRENVYMNGTLNGLSDEEIAARFDEIVAFAELEEFIDMPVRTYSSGMQMRLAFSVASYVNPDVLLLDEVLAVGDAAFQRKCMKRIYDFRRGGGTLVFVSHDASSVETVCDRAILVVHGEVVDDGEPADVLTTYNRMLADPGSVPRTRSRAQETLPLPVDGRSSDARMAIARLAEQGIAVMAACAGEGAGAVLACVEPAVTTPIDDVPTRGLVIDRGRVLRLVDTGEELGGGPGELMLYDGTGVSRYLRIDEIGGGAAVLPHGDGVAVAVPPANAVLVLDASGAVAERLTAPGVGDAWHLNGLAHDDAGRLVASAYGRFDSDREWVGERSRGAGALLDPATGDDVVTGLTWPRDPRRVEGGWLVCEASELRLTRIDDDGRRESLPLQGLARGLAVEGDLALVGESGDRWLAPGLEKGSVAVVSLSEWRVIGRVEVPSRQVWAVAAVPEALAEGMRTGFRVNPTRVLEQDQQDLFRQAGAEPERVWAHGDPLPPQGFRIRLLARPPFAPLPADSVASISYTLVNRSDHVLASAPPHPVRVSYRWLSESLEPLDDAGEPVRSLLPGTLPPKGEAKGSARVITPRAPGTYTLRLTLVQEMVSWFDEVDPANAVDLPVDVVSRETAAALGTPAENAPGTGSS
jgi:ABC-type polysaccharide/polyol phosphate transport system ATPase subunit